MTDENSKLGVMNRRRLLQLAGAVGATSAVSLNLWNKPAFAQAQDAKPSGRVVVGLSQEPTVFNPLMIKIEVDDGVNFSMFDALFRITPTGEITPNLATEVPTEQNGGISADGLQWRIKLRDDVKWHDGQPFTAEDVKFTLDLIVDKNFKSWRTLGHNLVRDISIVSPTEITWRMERPFSPYIALLTETFIVPKHILEPEPDRNKAAFNQAPIGTGAFKWGKRVAGDHLELVANPDYFGEGPYIERVIFKYIPDITVLYTQFKSGDIDIVGQNYITTDFYAEAKTLPNRVVTPEVASNIESFMMNTELPQFKDPAVRRALYFALDKQTILEQIFYSLPKETESVIPPSSAYYNPDLPKHVFDLEKAGKMLDEAGWVIGSGGLRQKDGVTLSFTNSTTSGNHLREQLQQYLQQVFAQIGVEMKISNLPPAVMWGEFWTQSKFECAIVGTNYTIAADPDLTNRFHSKSIPAKGGAGSNNSQYQNPKMDALLEKGSKIYDVEERKKIYMEVQSIIREDMPMLPLFVNAQVRGQKSNLSGTDINSNTRTESWHVAGWKVSN